MIKHFRGNPDYKAEFDEAVAGLIDRRIDDRQARIAAIDALIDEYVTAVGDRPDGAVLHRLANEILREELSDSHPDKMTREEFPIMSDVQLRRKTEGKHKRRTDKHGNKMPLQREVPLSLASDVGTDGRNHRFPTRRRLDVDEMIEKENALKEHRNAD